MKNNKYKLFAFLVFFSIAISFALSFGSCASSAKITAKSGAQLWAENCQRCHNTPSPSTFSPEKWETIGMHMQSRALLTNTERDKIVAFLKQ
ncbi:MAG TPA: cytochrome c [Hanamia sp.]|nr:cytochrome c [Hanamia sp.]